MPSKKANSSALKTSAPQKPAQAKEETYFVSIRSPLEVRRQVLECTRKTIQSLQNYQKIVLIRTQKIKEMETLKSSLKEIMYLNNKLNEKLPEYDYSTIIGPEKPDVSIQKITKKPDVKPQLQPKPVPRPIPKEKTELEKLEESLSSIEGRLKTLKKPGQQ